MHYKTEEEFAGALKAGPLRGVCLLYGAEGFLVESYTRRITAKYGGDFSSFNLQKLDGRRLDCDLLLDAVETLPMMAFSLAAPSETAGKCVVVDDLEPSKLPAGELEKLLEIAGDIPEDTVLVITGKGGFDQKSAAAKKLIKLCGEKGTAAELGARGTQGLISFLKSAAKRQGAELPTDLAKYILAICETDMATLNGEIAKICAYAGGEPLSRHHVDAVAVPRTEARVFDLGKAILARNPQRAMEILRDLFYLREQPVAIVSVLGMSYVDLYRARVAKDAGKSPADVVAAFGYKGREFRVNNAWNSRLPASALRRSLEALLDCDRKMKSTPADPKILLEQTVVRLFQLQG